MAKSKEKIRAREMRRSGRSIKSISRELFVSPGSVSVWCRDIKLTSEQTLNLEKNMRDPYYGKRLENVNKQKSIREGKEQHYFKKGRELVGVLSKRDLFIAGIALYWAEGYKKDHQVGLGSSDPEMIKVFIKWLKECFGYTDDDLILRVTINESHEYRIEDITKYWSETLNIPLEQFRKPFYQRVKWQKEYENPEEYYGVLRVRVKRSTDFLRKIKGMIVGLCVK